MRRPNILILYTDQLRWDALGVNGNPDVQTPNLDRLAADGANFDHCFVQNPVCMPSRASFLTGQYPSTLGITHMGVPLPEDTLTLPRLLSSYGYTSANLGKLHFLPHANRDHRVPHPHYGFDQIEISDEPGVYEDAYRAWVRRQQPDQLEHLSVGLPPATAVWYETMGIEDRVKHPTEGGRFDFKGPIPFPGDEHVTHSAFVADRTVEFLRKRGHEPFLCIAGFYSPHAPWVTPQRFLDQYTPQQLTVPGFPPELVNQGAAEHFPEEQLQAARHGYYGMISEVDHYVGHILDVLEARGLADDTIVIFTSDHGEWLGEHLRYGKGYPAHDQCSRVPLMVRWPDRVPAGQTVSHIVEAVDVVPTLLDCAGIQIAPHLQGQSLWPLLQGSDRPLKSAALTEHHGWKSLRSERFRYVVHTNGHEHLYDLDAEWGDYRDVAGRPDYSAEQAEMRHALIQRMLEMERPLPRVWTY
ncbi:MAG: sulfatase-like hydrolase/transferase [Caldilineaceae bacterium]|nr:sulfatase-like hydrolase/transferase [Caldilineaceae bacterium]